jgi:hypothetical protein
MLSGCDGLLVSAGMAGIIERENKTKCWQYVPNLYQRPSQKFERTAVVLPFNDGRQSNYTQPFLRCWIPFTLYCTFEFEPPEGSSGLNAFQNMSKTNPYTVRFSPKEDFATALSTELEAAGIFRSVTFGADSSKSDYIIRGTILDTTLDNTVYTYGFLFIGMCLWFAGVPAGTYSNDLALELSCTDTRTGKTILSKVYRDKETRPFWIYAQPNVCRYGEMTESMYKQFVEELRAALQKEADKKGSSENLGEM